MIRAIERERFLASSGVMGRARLWPRRAAEAPGRGAHTKPCQPDKEAAIPPHHTCRRPRMLWQAVGVMPGFWGGGRWGKTEGAAHTKDLLDSRSLVYYSLTLTIYDVCPGRGSSVSACPDHSAYTRSCGRPMPGYPYRSGGGEGTGEGKRPRAWCLGLLCSVCEGLVSRGYTA